MTTISARARTGLLSATTAAALAAALAAPAAASSGGTPSGSGAGSAATGSAAAPTAAPTAPSLNAVHRSSRRPTLVTLLTGDRVLLRTDQRGHTITSLTVGSPDYGRPVQFVDTGSHTWVVPRVAGVLSGRLAPSVFDLAALAAPGRVPLRVTFARGATPRALPGLRVRTSRARAAARGRTVALASYDAHRPLPARLAASLRGVARISVAGAAPQVDPGYALHTLTIDGTTSGQAPIKGSSVFVFNADDSRLFGTFGFVTGGQWKVSVPPGHYDLVLSNFYRSAVTQVVVGDADTTATLSFADATVRPTMTVPGGLTSLSPELDILGTDATGQGGFDFGWEGHVPLVTPLPAVAAGTLDSELSNLWTAKGYQPVTFHHGQVQTHPIRRVVGAKEYHAGIPAHFAYHYSLRHFADVAIRHYATGPKQSAFDSWVAFSPVDQFLFVQGFPSVRPSTIHAQFLARNHLVWDSSTTASQGFRNFAELDEVAAYHRDQHAVVPFFRGPVTPVADRGAESARVDYHCQLCVIDGQLGGTMAMLASAGTRQSGFSTTGRFALYHRFLRLSHGKGFLAPFVRHVTPGERMRLVASLGPVDSRTVLSQHVSDVYHFAVPPGSRAIVPLLRAAYVPPTNLHSVGRRGQVSFPVTFDNLGPVDARIGTASVRWSVDGSHWHRARLTRKDKNTFRVSYAEPAATVAHPYLSLEVRARDAGGRSISETVEHAYLLPRATARRAHAHRPAAHRNVFHPARLCRTSGRTSYSCYVKLDARTLASGRSTPDPAGWGAPALRQAYGLGADPNPGTVAIIVAYDYPHAEADMNHYRAQYGLPACTSAGGCFTKLNQDGQSGSYPPPDADWGVEASLDLQMVSAACPTCHIVLVEANQPSDRAFYAAEQTAVDAGATVVNHSFGRIELTGDELAAANYDHPGVTDVASTGDSGYGPASFPASSPHVLAVGGTTLSRSTTDPRGWTEQAWEFGSSGCSAYFGKPTGQSDTACQGRTEADLSAVADGLAIYNTSLPRRYRGWLTVGGTSASSPLVSGMIGSSGVLGVTPQTIYANQGLFNDVVSGSNGYCLGSYLCTAGQGYDGPTGVGTPEGVGVFATP